MSKDSEMFKKNFFVIFIGRIVVAGLLFNGRGLHCWSARLDLKLEWPYWSNHFTVRNVGVTTLKVQNVVVTTWQLEILGY